MPNMNTRLIISAEDRGATRLLRKMGTEADSAVDKFGQLGSSITALVGGFTAGYGIKTALGWIDEYKIDVISVATTLTDTMRGSGKDIQKVFEQNTIHAEEFFKVLRLQSMKSIADFDDLRSAYAIFTSKGLSLDATQSNAKGLADLVDRITLATRAQNQNVQVPQELRAILQGTARPVDTVAKMFIERDVNFQKTIKRLVSEGNGAKAMEYMGGLLSDVPIESAVQTMLRKSISNVKESVKQWALDAFDPLYTEINSIMRRIGEDIFEGKSPFLNGIENLVKSLTSAVRVTSELFSKFAGSSFGKFLMEAAPQLLAVATAATIAARAFGLLKAAAMASMTGVGAVALAAGGLVVGSSWAEKQPTREQVTESTKERNFHAGEDTWNYLKSFLADSIDLFLSFGKGTIIEITNYVKYIVESAVNFIKSLPIAMAEIWESIKGTFYDLSAKTLSVVDKISNFISDIFLKIYYDFQKAWQYIIHPVNADKRDEAIEDIKRKETIALATPNTSMFSDQIKKLNDLTVESDKRRAGYTAEYSKLGQQSFSDFLKTIGVGFDAMYQTFTAKQDARRNATQGNAAQPAIDSSAITGKGSTKSADSILEESVKEYQKSLAKLSKDSAGLDAVMAQLESATLKGGDSLEYALSQVSKEYENYKAKIARLAGGQDVMSEIDTKILAEKNLQADLEKKIAEAKGDELELLQKQLAESKANMSWLYGKAQIDLTEKINEKQQEALKLADRFYTEQRRIRTVSEADKLSDKVYNLQGILSGIGGRSERSEYIHSQLQESLEIQKQLSELQRDTDLFPNTESEAQAKERINKLQTKYLELYKQTTAEMDIQRAKAEYMASLASENSIASGFKAGVQDIADNVTSTFTHIRTLTTETFSAMQSTMSNVFFDFFSGELDSAKDYFSAFGQSILQAFSDMLAKMLVEYITTTMTMKAIGGMLSGIFGALGGIGSIGGFAAGATTTQLGGVSASQAVTLTAANGGVFPGGFQAFASGGIVNQPTLGLVGEGRYNEAVVPLPDGRSIPVNMHGGGTSVVVNVIDNTGGNTNKSVNKEIDEQGNMIIDIILDAVSRNRKGARSQFKTALGVA